MGDGGAFLSPAAPASSRQDVARTFQLLKSVHKLFALRVGKFGDISSTHSEYEIENRVKARLTLVETINTNVVVHRKLHRIALGKLSPLLVFSSIFSCSVLDASRA